MTVHGCVYVEIRSYAHIDGVGSGELKKLIFLLLIYLNKKWPDR